MTLYLDTSVLVRALVREAGSDEAQRWLAAQDPETCAVSDWVLTEFSAALSLKRRLGTLRDVDRAAATATLARLVAQSMTLLPVERRHFRLAAELAERHELGLRSGDALHLAIASAEVASLATLDRKLAQAAQALGVPVEVP